MHWGVMHRQGSMRRRCLSSMSQGPSKHMQQPMPSRTKSPRRPMRWGLTQGLSNISLGPTASPLGRCSGPSTSCRLSLLGHPLVPLLVGPCSPSRFSTPCCSIAYGLLSLLCDEIISPVGLCWWAALLLPEVRPGRVPNGCPAWWVPACQCASYRLAARLSCIVCTAVSSFHHRQPILVGKCLWRWCATARVLLCRIWKASACLPAHAPGCDR